MDKKNKKINAEEAVKPDELKNTAEGELSDEALDSVAGGLSFSVNLTLGGELPGTGIK